MTSNQYFFIFALAYAIRKAARTQLPKRGHQFIRNIVTGRHLNSSMGPKPKLAASMSDNDTIAMWQYDVTDNRAAMVFLDDAGCVAEVVFFPTDVMY